MKVFLSSDDNFTFCGEKEDVEGDAGGMEDDSGGESSTNSHCFNCGWKRVGDSSIYSMESYEDEFNESYKLWSVQMKHRGTPHQTTTKNSDSNHSVISPSAQWLSLLVINNLRNANNKKLMMRVMLVTVMMVLLGLPPSPSVSLVSAIEMHPHGGIYQREGGNDFIYTSAAQQQSFFGSGGVVGGGGGGGEGRSSFGGGHGGLGNSHDFGEDMGDMIMTCSRPMKSSRAAKYLAIKQLDIPCDMGDKKSAWCNLPGDKYPWHAVRRFVFENQGLMRRMYGEVRQLSLLRMEFEDDSDDEIEDERHGPPRAPSIPEDHRRNSILTEVLDESLPRVLSETPPEDQILLKEHRNLLRQRERDASTPRSLPSSSSSSPVSSPEVFEALSTLTSTTSATTTPVMISSGSSEEQQGNATEVMMGVTVDTLSGGLGAFDLNGTATATTTMVMGGETTDTGATPGMTASTSMGRNEDFIVTEEATQESTNGGMTETENDEAVVTTTEEMLASSLSDQMVTLGEAEAVVAEQIELGGGTANIPVQQLQQEQQSDLELGGSGITVNEEQQQLPLDTLGDATGSAAVGGSDESHDFLNLDKNHILYFVDSDKTKKNGGGGGSTSGTSGGNNDVPPSQPGKLKAVNACPVKEEVVAPYWANNTRGEILALLNLYPFEQYIHWERCNHENKQMFCRQGCRCEQQYRLHRLLAFDPTNECRGIFSDWFRFPSCCVCRCYLNEYELMMLNAAGQDPPPSSSQAKSRTSERIRSPRKLLLDQLVDGPDVQGVDDMHFFYKQGFYHEHNHGAQPRKKRSLFPTSPN